MVTQSDPRQQRSNHAPRGIPLANPVQVQFTCEWSNPGGIDRNLPHMKSSLPTEWATSSGSEVQDSLGTCRVICSSSLGSGVGQAEAGVGATGSFSVKSNIYRFRRLSPLRRGPRHWWSSCTTTCSTPMGIPDQTAQLWRATARVIVSSFLTSW